VNVAGRLDRDVTTTGDRLRDWTSARESVLDIVAQDGVLDTEVDSPMGKIPLGRFLAVFMEVDTLIHTWDIARAVGADEALDEELCRRCYERFLPADEAMRASGAFGPKLDSAEDDPTQVKMLRFFGRPG